MLTQTARAEAVKAASSLSPKVDWGDAVSLLLRRKLHLLAAAAIISVAAFGGMFSFSNLQNSYKFSLVLPEAMSPSEFERFRRSLVVERTNAEHFVSEVGALLAGEPTKAKQVLAALDPDFGNRSNEDVMTIDPLFDGGVVAGVSVVLRGHLAPDSATLIEKFKSKYFAPGLTRFFWMSEIQNLSRSFKERSDDAQRAILEYSLYTDWYEQQLASARVLSDSGAIDPQVASPVNGDRVATSDANRVGKFVVPSHISLLPLKHREVALKLAIAELKALVSIEHSYMLRRDALLQALDAIADPQLADATNFSNFLKATQTQHLWAAEALEPLQLSLRGFRGKVAETMSFQTRVVFTDADSRLARLLVISSGLGLIIGAALVFGMEYLRELRSRPRLQKTAA